MDRTGRAQSLAGIATVVALPLLYIGGSHQIPVLTGVGLVLFTAAMLTTPAMRLLSPPTAAATAQQQSREK